MHLPGVTVAVRHSRAIAGMIGASAHPAPSGALSADGAHLFREGVVEEDWSVLLFAFVW